MTDPKTKLTPHFSLAEMTASTSHPEIYNVPTPLVVENLTRVCQWLEKLREAYNSRYGTDAPIRVSSGYRSQKLNRAVGGVNDSNHLTGCAADLICRDATQVVRYAALLIELFEDAKQQWDEIIIEKKYERFWLHFAVRPDRNRGKVTTVVVR